MVISEKEMKERIARCEMKLRASGEPYGPIEVMMLVEQEWVREQKVRQIPDQLGDGAEKLVGRQGLEP